jgi:hypothetical protein
MTVLDLPFIFALALVAIAAPLEWRARRDPAFAARMARLVERVFG